MDLRPDNGVPNTPPIASNRSAGNGTAAHPGDIKEDARTAKPHGRHQIVKEIADREDRSARKPVLMH